MKRFHISLSVADLDESIAEYSRRLGEGPCVVEDGRYALWRTGQLNFTISCKPGQFPGAVRHIGFEDASEPVIREETDVNGVTWEYFSEEAQAREIKEKFPNAKRMK